MGTEYEAREREAKPAVMTDDAVRVLTEILNQVRSGLQPPPLSEEAKAAVAIYNANRATLDHETKRPAVR